ncbi:phosphatase PAP2 family protein [Methanobrevibacter sp.]|uniref:phosphatase PAP2 family protein n=1 Tax=Methanobrevibacter sp. TaxID=66852 RepID=UPI003869B9E7
MLKIILMNLNIDLFYFINNDLANPLFDVIMPHLSDCGGFVTLLVLCILAILVLRYYKKEKYLEIAKMCLYALVLSGIIAACLKLTYHSPRPFTVLEHVRQLVVPTEPNSFPSGHSSSSMSVVTVLVWCLRDNKILITLLIAFALLVAFSRVYVGVHYPFDVFVGALVGVVSGVVVLKLKNQK